MIEILPNYHPVFVHFPIALIITSTIMYGLALCFKATNVSKELFIVSKWCLWLGGVFAIVTAYTGWLAYNSVAHDEVSHQAMTMHKNWGLPTAAVIAVGSLISVAYRKVWGLKYRMVSFLGLLLMTILVSITSYLGAENVYRYGLGVVSLPTHGETNHEHHAPETSTPPQITHEPDPQVGHEDEHPHDHQH